MDLNGLFHGGYLYVTASVAFLIFSLIAINLLFEIRFWLKMIHGRLMVIDRKLKEEGDD